jgi:hypothetical protein
MGQRKGYRQTTEHIRKRFENNRTCWKGDAASVKTGRSRAERIYPDAPTACDRYGVAGKRLDRHHKDENTLNNERSNISFLCRRCHMTVDGRLNALQASAKATIAIRVEASAAARRARTKCKRGHLLNGDNLYIYDGKRICKECRKIHKADQLKRNA